MFERDDHLVAGTLSGPRRTGTILGVIFAGGASQRYGRDKAAAELDGISLLHRVSNCIRPQVDVLAVSGKERPQLPIPNIPDELTGGGPLAALCSILRLAEREGWPFVATVSCDTPFIPGDFVGKLHSAIGGHDCALAICRGVSHPTCALWATAARAKIEVAFNSGERSLHHTIARLDTIEVDFSSREGGPNGDPFFNINYQTDLAVAQVWLNETRGAA